MRSSVVGSSAVTDAARGSGTSAASSPTVDPAPNTVTLRSPWWTRTRPRTTAYRCSSTAPSAITSVPVVDLELGGSSCKGRERPAGDVGEQPDPLERDDALDGGHRHGVATGGWSRAASSSTRSGRSQARA